MFVLRNVSVAICSLLLCFSASAGELMQATNGELWNLYKESENPEEAEQLIRNWIDGYINGFESAYRLEAARNDGGKDQRLSCVTKYDDDLIYLMLITAGVKENAKDLLAVDTMYLILRFGCEADEDLGALPSWIKEGGYDELGVHIPENDAS